MTALVAGTLSFVLGMALLYFWIGMQRRSNVNYAQKSYGVGIDVEIKAATPTMGGCVFVLLALLFLLAERTPPSALNWSLPIACGAIGFVDDWLKYSRKSAEGFSSLRKLKAQILVATLWILPVLAQKDLRLWPGMDCPAFLTVPFAILATVSMMNAVNITDGLDGLAGGMVMISLGVLAYLLPKSALGGTFFAALFGMTASFLLYNARPARIFMGDTGSHFLGGALVALCVQGDMLLALFPAGFLFGIELLSSAVQIVGIRKFGRKVFKMAPLHHHFQRAGWDETTVTFRFLVVHAVGAAFLAALLAYINIGSR